MSGFWERQDYTNNPELAPIDANASRGALAGLTAVGSGCQEDDTQVAAKSPFGHRSAENSADRPLMDSASPRQEIRLANGGAAPRPGRRRTTAGGRR